MWADNVTMVLCSTVQTSNFDVCRVGMLPLHYIWQVWVHRVPSLRYCQPFRHRWTMFPSHFLWTDWLWWGNTMSQNCGHQRAPTGNMWTWTATVMMMPAVDNSWLIHHSYVAVLPAGTAGASRRNGRRSENFAYQYLKYLKGSFICRKILRHGPSGFTSHPKEGVLWIFILFKSPSPQPGLNPQPFGPVASTLTITPPRQHFLWIQYTFDTNCLGFPSHCIYLPVTRKSQPSLSLVFLNQHRLQTLKLLLQDLLNVIIQFCFNKIWLTQESGSILHRSCYSVKYLNVKWVQVLQCLLHVSIV
jgi:hypothetical protein